MSDFTKTYAKLNKAQRAAVDTIDGPLLVIAGPGTGKTQLLSARVAHILKETDTLPENILCLTFTESGAKNMRDRLTRFIGKTAYDVQISTYHAFGGDLIKRYGQYFLEARLEQPVDELGRHQILQAIVAAMSYRNPLKQTQHHLGDLIASVSEVKRALLTPNDLRAIAKENIKFVESANAVLITELAGLTSMTSFKKVYPHFEALLPSLARLIPQQPVHERFGTLAQSAVAAMQEALALASETNKTTPLTKWKNSWLVKNAENQFILGGMLENERIIALAGVCEQYQAILQERGLFDFDDMILRSIAALEQHDDFKYTLQERFQYVLLDEFQDTNAAQLRLIELLTDNPVNEGRPNVMAVGDDDQAIYAFQGAQYSNMLDFYQMYRDVRVVNLTENYRSHGDILATAEQISTQISARLHHNFEGATKTLIATNQNLKTSNIERIEFLSDIGQFDWIAEHIQQLIQTGVNPSEIAVLAPKHKHIEPLVSYLNELDIPVRYEKRENILDAPIVAQLLTMARLLRALAQGNNATANALWPQILSYDFWEIPISTIWRLSWKVREDKQTSWAEVALENADTRQAALLLLTLASKISLETCETMLDFLMGNEATQTNEPDFPNVQSPLKSFHTKTITNQPDYFYETLSHLTVLRAKLRDHQKAHEKTLKLNDLLDLVDMYELAGERMLNTSPYSQASEAVQLMTVYKAKGLEFEHVFLVACQDDVWGGSSRGNGNKLTLPANLEPIRHAGATDDERLRTLFVAITRAKTGLYLTSYKQTFAGKPTRSLKYLDEQEQPDGTHLCKILPENKQLVQHNAVERPAIENLSINWQQRHTGGLPDVQLRQLLQENLESYQISPTHLNNFIDTIYGGPEAFFLNTILRFPQAPSISGQYGSAVHETLEWVQETLNTTGKLPATSAVLEYFDHAIKQKGLTSEQAALESERGQHALAKYMKDRGHYFKKGNLAEHNFKHEGVFIGDAHLSGKIDLIELDKESRTITVVDYKTGGGYDRWKPDPKLHKYKQQLYAYKILIEKSHTFKDYTVTSGRLEFVEPNADGIINQLELQFKPEELERTSKLLQAMWARVKALDFPDISCYSKDLKGIVAFENDLLTS